MNTISPIPPRVRLRTYLVAGYALFIVYASLSPFSGWRDMGLEFSAVLATPLLLHFIWFDVMANLLAYLPFPTFFLAVAISGWLGGFGPAMLATALSTVLARYFYMSPLHELAIDNVLNAVSICMFVVVALALAALTAMLRAALQKIHHLTAPAKAGESAPGLKAHNPAKPRLLA